MLEETLLKSESIAVFAAVFVCLCSIVLHKYILKTKFLSLKESISNIVIFLIWRFFFFAGGAALQFGIYTFISNLTVFKIENTPANFAICLLVMDFAYYWKHRIEHQIGFLWAQHAVHHSSSEFNFTTSLRLPWVGSYINWGPFAVVAMLGFSPAYIVLGYKLILSYQYLVHTRLVKKLGFLEKILNTPSNHRVHHGKNPQYVDKNYGGILIIWDIIFKTYEPEVEEVEYGTLSPMESHNPFIINFQPWLELGQKYIKVFRKTT